MISITLDENEQKQLQLLIDGAMRAQGINSLPASLMLLQKIETAKRNGTANTAT